MRMFRQFGWLLLSAAAVVALVATPQAQATHLPGFGHDNTVAAGDGTGTICNVDDGCLIAENNTGGTNAIAVKGVHTSTVGAGAGVYGQTNSGDAFAAGVQGLVTSSTPSGLSAGVFGANNGTSLGVIGVRGRAGTGTAIIGSSLNAMGVVGSAPTGGTGVFGGSDGGSDVGYGVQGETSSPAADAAGVYGHIQSGAANAAGVRGYNASFPCCGMGVAGFHAGQGIGVYGEAPSGFAVSGFSPNNWSGYFQGAVRVVGTLTKSAGAFRIDHPLDPAHRYLQHSFVESPEMKNVYDGNVLTNGQGFAPVKLPAYFQALNKDFRYQLTIVGTRGWQARVVREIANNRFTIQTDLPGVKVSWQVTGIRKDPYANAHRIQVVVPKEGAAAGKYVHPELYGKPLTKSVVVLPGMDPKTRAKFTKAAALPTQR